jgi:hypothetical protein
MTAAAGARWRRWPSLWRSPAGAAAPFGIDLAEIADIDARLAALGDSTHPYGLERRLSPLVDRGVPVRHIAAAPCFRACRVRFADGTTVLARGAHPGDVAVLVTAIRSHSLPPQACTTDVEGTHLVFAWPCRGGTLTLLVTGMDQAT